MPISTLPFSDLYVRLDGEDRSLYRPLDVGAPGLGTGILPVPEQYEPDIKELRRELIAKDMAEGSLMFQNIPLRVARQKMANDAVWVALRRVRTKVPSLEGLGINPLLIPTLQQLGSRTGLILMAGATGAGKTTTAAALLADYLRRYGGLAYTVEDPVEYRMQGEHGKNGYCFQVEIKEDEEWAGAIKIAKRCHPTIIFVGELRTSAAAKQLILAATSGHLVITTIHSGSIEEAIYSLVQMAQPELGELSHTLVADSLVAVVHQQMLTSGPKMSLLVTDENLGDPIRACIRSNRIPSLATHVDSQAARMGANGSRFFNPVRPTQAGSARPVTNRSSSSTQQE